MMSECHAAIPVTFYADADFVVSSPTHLDLTAPVEPLFSKHGEANSWNKHRKTGTHRALDVDWRTPDDAEVGWVDLVRNQYRQTI